MGTTESLATSFYFFSLAGKAISGWQRSPKSLWLIHWKSDAGFNQSMIGILEMFARLPNALVQIGVAGQSDKIESPLLVSAVTLLLTGMCCMLLGYTDNYWVVLGLITLMGFGTGMVHSCSVKACKSSDKDGFLYGMLMTCKTSARVVGNLTFLHLREEFTWGQTMDLMTIPTLIFCTTCLVYIASKDNPNSMYKQVEETVVKTTKKQKKSQQPSSYAMIKRPRFILLTACLYSIKARFICNFLHSNKILNLQAQTNN